MKLFFLLAFSITFCSLSLSAQLEKKDPLVVVDGKPYTSGINSIDPKTIESVNVLKDQAATDVYGELGKNGVILVNTKDNN